MSEARTIYERINSDLADIQPSEVSILQDQYSDMATITISYRVPVNLLENAYPPVITCSGRPIDGIKTNSHSFSQQEIK